MRRHLLTIILLLTAVTTAMAKPRTAAQLRLEASKVLNKTAMAKGATAADPEILRSESQLTIFGIEGVGFTIIANDDSFNPVLGYSDASTTDNHSPAFLWWVEAINASLEQKLAAGERQQTVTRAADYPEAVDEMLTTRWNQGAPYNLRCPTYTLSGVSYNYVTGCVATAMSQIMYYHKYPTTGASSHSYSYTSPEFGNRVTASANFGRTTYDYDNMLTEYVDGNYNDTQAQAVATLMLHCGVAVDMNYTTSGSGAYSQDACRGLRKYFRYDENIKHYFRDFFPVNEWMNMIYGELSDGCPILYGGVSTAGGHSFVLDGYDADGLVHVNWGWGGSDNGYFDIATLDGYAYNQDLVTVRMPNDETYNSHYHSVWGMGLPLVCIASGSNISLSCEAMYNVDVDSFTGQIAVIAYNMETGEQTVLGVIFDETQLNDIESLRGLQFSNVEVPTSALSEGTYRIYIATKSVLEDEWQPVRSHESTNNSYRLVIVNGQLVLTPENDSNWTTAIALPSTTTDARPADGRIYSIDGRYIGTDASTLSKGMYIRNGRKFVVK